MALAISSALFLFLVAAIVFYAHRVYLKPARVVDQISAADQAYAPAGIETAPGFQLNTVLQWVGEKLPQSPGEAKLTRRLLSAAGYKSDVATAIYMGIRVSAVIGLALVVFVILQQFRVSTLFHLAAVALAGFVGYMLPSFVLDELVKARKERIRFALPDMLDLLVVCVESGLGLDQAVRMVTDELAIAHPDLSKELSLVSLEMRAGANRATALRNLADRTGEEEVRKLTAVLIQTDRFGTSLAESLRAHAEFLRVRRRNEAEERAGKIGVKLTFPIFFCILPSIMVVAVGPAVIRIINDLLPALRNPGMGR